MNILKLDRGRGRDRIAERIHAVDGDRRRARSSRNLMHGDPMTAVALRTLR